MLDQFEYQIWQNSYSRDHAVPDILCVSGNIGHLSVTISVTLEKLDFQYVHNHKEIFKKLKYFQSSGERCRLRDPFNTKT